MGQLGIGDVSRDLTVGPALGRGGDGRNPRAGLRQVASDFVGLRQIASDCVRLRQVRQVHVHD